MVWLGVRKRVILLLPESWLQGMITDETFDENFDPQKEGLMDALREGLDLE